MLRHSGTALALSGVEQNNAEGSDIMKAPKKTASIFQWAADPAATCIGQTRARVAEVMVSDPIPGRVCVPAAGHVARARKEVSPLVLYERKGDVGFITAKVNNVGEVYDEIDALLDEIERDKDVRTVAIFTLDGLFASLPIR
jgi:hypothetical protein